MLDTITSKHEQGEGRENIKERERETMGEINKEEKNYSKHKPGHFKLIKISLRGKGREVTRG